MQLACILLPKKRHRSFISKFMRAGTAVLVAGVAMSANAANVLIVNGASTTSESGTTSAITSTLQGQLTSRGNTVTVSNGLTGSLSGINQVWDLRFSNASALSAAEQSQYLSFVGGGGNLFVMGENASFASRNNSILSLISSAGGGTITLAGVRSVATQTLAGGNQTVTFRASDIATSAGTGKFLSTLPDGTGSAIAWEKGRLTNAQNGALSVVFDVNFMDSSATAGEQALLATILDLIERGVIAIDDTQDIERSIIKQTSEIKLRSSVQSIVNAISNRITNAISHASGSGRLVAGRPMSGLNGGDQSGLPISTWVDVTRSSFRDSDPGNAFKGRTTITLIGVDYLADEDAVIGISTGIENTGIEYNSNQNENSARGKSVTFYAGYQIIPHLGVDAQIGYSKMKNGLLEQSRRRLVSSDFTSDRYFAAVNLTSNYSWEDFRFEGGLGYLIATEKYDEHVSSDNSQVSVPQNHFAQAALKGNVGYQFDSVLPFVRAAYEVDTASKSKDRNGGKLGLGVRYTPLDNLSMILAGDTVVGRKDERNVSINAGLRYSF